VTVDTGATTTAVPVQNTSSAPIRSSMETRRSSTLYPRSLASSMTLLRVMPGRMVPRVSGVATTPPLTTNTLHDDTSSRCRLWTESRYSTSVNPLLLASICALSTCSSTSQCSPVRARRRAIVRIDLSQRTDGTYRRVVGDGLDPAGAAGHRAVELVMHHQVDGRQSLLKKRKKKSRSPRGLSSFASRSRGPAGRTDSVQPERSRCGSGN
jgi:hypothetical protein